MAYPLVSVIIPAYNAEQFLRKTLESVRNQTYPDFEAIIVDDGSTDQTAVIAREFCGKDPRFKLLSQENLGVAAARNLAIEKSSGEYIAPLDADDIWYPEKLERQVGRLACLPGTTGFVYTSGLSINEFDEPIGKRSYDFEGDVFLEILSTNFVLASSPLFRRKCFEVVGNYNPEFRAARQEGVEDWDLLVRICRHFEAACVQEFLVGYRDTPGSMSKDFEAMRRGIFSVMDKARQRYPDVPPQLVRWTKGSLLFNDSIFYFKQRKILKGFILLNVSLIYDPIQALAPLALPRYLRKRGTQLFVREREGNGAQENAVKSAVEVESTVNSLGALRFLAGLRLNRLMRLKRRLRRPRPTGSLPAASPGSMTLAEE